MKLPTTLKLYWFVPFIFTIGAALGWYSSNEYFWSIFIAYLACGIALHASRYSWIAPSSLFIVGHIVQYPLAAHIVLTLRAPEMAIEPEIWPVTPDAMEMCTVGMLCFALALAWMQRRRYQVVAPGEFERWITTFKYNAWLTAFCIIPIGIYLASGIYYHKNIEGNYNVAASQTLGFVGYLFYASICGPLLQVRRYLITKSKSDLYGIFFLAMLFFSIVGPSGTRRHILLLFFMMLLYYLQKETRKKLKLVVLTAGSIALISLLPLLESYRSGVATKGDGLIFRIEGLFDTIVRFDSGTAEVRGDSVFWIGLGRRLADYTSPGFIKHMVPNPYPHTGFSDVIEWPVFMIPTLIRPSTSISFTYDIDAMDLYAFRPMEETDGSSPLMFIGDLYNRGGWVAIVVGMLFAGCIFAILNYYLTRDSFIPLVTLIMMADYLTSMHAMTLLKFFVMLTRHLAIYLFIGFLLKKIAFPSRPASSPIPVQLSASSYHILPSRQNVR